MPIDAMMTRKALAARLMRGEIIRKYTASSDGDGDEWPPPSLASPGCPGRAQ
jgi:hypothetical protein